MFHFKRQKQEKGFTIVELMVVAPVVILTIGAFVTVIVGMTGDVLASRSSSNLLFNIQDALNRVEQDIKLSSAFLAVNNITPQTGQGFDDGTAGFKNVDATTGTMLILNSIATTGNPLVTGSAYVYAQNAPNACTNTLVTQNTPQSTNVIYFVKYVSGVGTLWRRTVMQSNYTDTAASWCNLAWQEPSCSPGYTASFCKTQDVQLVTGLSTSGLSIQYYNSANSTSENTAASLATNSDTVRGTALQSATTATVTITASQTVAGRTSSQTSTMRATRLDVNASSTVVPVTPTTPTAPVVTATLSGADSTSATFTWERVAGATGYNLDYNINGGSWVSGLSNSSATSYTVQGTRNQPVNVRVSAINSAATPTTSGYGNATITIPLFTPMILLNGWSDYGGVFSTSGYTKTSEGMVVLKGLVKGGSASLVPIAQLPPGYRPGSDTVFQNSANSSVARVDVDANGNVLFEVGSNAWYSLDGINFMPSSTSFTALTTLNGWTNYAAPTYPAASYYVDASDSNRVHLQGLVKGGTTTDGTPIVTIPTSLQPSGYEHVSNDANNGLGFIGVNYVSGQIVAKGTSNAFLGLNALFYPAAYPTGTTCTTSWCTLPLSNSWVWYGSPYSSPRFTKSPDGMVLVKGLIKGGSVTSQAVIGTLPAGFCPKQELIITTVASGAWGRIDVTPATSSSTGCTLIVGQASSASASWTSLDDISFMDEW